MDRTAAELERLAAVIDAQSGDERVDNLARRVAERLEQSTK
jgi:hypothetical protein